MINNDNEYELALLKLASLWNFELNTPEGQKAEILINLIEKYEKEVLKIDI